MIKLDAHLLEFKIFDESCDKRNHQQASNNIRT